MIIPFIGYGSAIKSITLSKSGEVLYYNPTIEDNYDRINFEDIALAELQLLSAQTTILKMSKKI